MSNSDEDKFESFKQALLALKAYVESIDDEDLREVFEDFNLLLQGMLGAKLGEFPEIVNAPFPRLITGVISRFHALLEERPEAGAAKLLDDVCDGLEKTTRQT